MGITFGRLSCCLSNRILGFRISKSKANQRTICDCRKEGIGIGEEKFKLKVIIMIIDGNTHKIWMFGFWIFPLSQEKRNSETASLQPGYVVRRVSPLQERD